MKTLVAELRTSLVMILFLTLVVCGIYPVVVWGLGQLLFPHQANGSLVYIDGHAVGSSLIGQPFSGPTYFHPRPSTAGEGYDATSSGGSNLGPLSKKLSTEVRDRIARYRQINSLEPTVPVPADAVTSSASGLDPHISMLNAMLQAPRIAQARGVPLDTVMRQIRRITRDRQFGFLGEPRVNVLLANLALDGKLGVQ